LVGENFGEFGKLNVIRQYFTQPNLSPLFVKLLTSGYKVWVETWGTSLGSKMLILKYLHALDEAETKFRLIIFIFVITSKDTFYPNIDHYRSHDLSNYWLWVSASLNTNYFSELTEDNSPSDLTKFFSCQ